MCGAGASVTEPVAPAFYALRAGGWRDYVTLLHPPYTLWHLSYVAIGAALAPAFHTDRLVLALAAFFLALGVAAHALDELNGRPLRTEIPARALVVLAALALAGAVAIGVAAAAAWGWGLLAFVAVGAVLVPAYNLEWFGGAVHTGLGFALAWGAFPVLTAYVAQAGHLGVAAVLGATGAAALAFAPRALSTPARLLRRRARGVDGTIVLDDGTLQAIDAPTLLRPLEVTLRALTGAVVLLAAAMVIARLW